MEQLECYVLMNIDATNRSGYLSETLSQNESTKIYEIEGPWDAFTNFTGSMEDIKKFGGRMRSAKGVRVAETYIVRDSIAQRSSDDQPVALITGNAQPRYASSEVPVDIQVLLDTLSKYKGMGSISAVLGGIDLIGEINGNLGEWHVARRQVLKDLPPYVTIETHRVISLDPGGSPTTTRLSSKLEKKFRDE